MTFDLSAISEVALGAALGIGSFMGATRSRLSMLKDDLRTLGNRLESRFDALDKRLDQHDLRLATLPCVKKVTVCDGTQKA